MSKKISVCFRDAFEPGEFDRLTELVIRTLRSEFPGFIVHTDVVEKYRELFIVYVYGLWGDDSGQSVADTASKTVERLLSNVSWRKAYQPAPPIYEERRLPVVVEQPPIEPEE
jgi:hypothetical protein